MVNDQIAFGRPLGEGKGVFPGGKGRKKRGEGRGQVTRTAQDL